MNGRAPTGQALAVPATPASAVDGPSGFDPSRGLFNYTSAQHFNIHLGLHPDCCQDRVCSFCGASEEVDGGACWGELTGLSRELFEEASCSARNANVRSIGQFTNWKVHDRHARAFDAAARAIATEARRAETENTGSVHEGAGRNAALPENKAVDPYALGGGE